jgi:hypothetical protein
MAEEQQSLTRRHLVRRALAAAAIPAMGTGAPARSSTVVLARQADALDSGHAVNRTALRRMLADVLEKVTGRAGVAAAWRSLVSPGDIVGLVPTDHLNKTHPELIELVQATLVEAGVPQSNIRIAQGSSAEARACTALISMPALKAHWLTGIGTVLKNYITFSGHPSAYHDAANVKLGEIWSMPQVKGKTRLVLVDALRPLCDKGPQPDPRYLWNYNGLIAGTDPVAVETVCLQVILKKRQALKGEPWPLSPPPLCVEAADRTYGLGTSRMDEIRLERLGWTAEALV